MPSAHHETLHYYTVTLQKSLVAVYLIVFSGHFDKVWINFFATVSQDVDNPVGWISCSTTGLVCWAADGHVLESRVAV